MPLCKMILVFVRGLIVSRAKLSLEREPQACLEDTSFAIEEGCRVLSRIATLLIPAETNSYKIDYSRFHWERKEGGSN